MSAPAPFQQQAPPPVPVDSKPSAIDNKDIDHWKNQFNAALADTSKITAPKTEGRSWSSGLFGCFSPIDLCCVTYFCPCVTFGKTHHRLHKDASMAGYQPINTSCLLFLGAACFGLHWVPEALQRQFIREKHGLEGSCLGDIARACCCAVCDLTQQEKESLVHASEAEKHSAAQYSNGDAQMKYAA